MRGTTLTYVAKREDFVYIPWIAEDGSRNVIHRVGLRPPGGYRGVSAFAPLMAFAKQVKGIIEAYVVAKRVQACHPIFIQVDDPVAAAKADRNGAVWGNNTTLEPGKVYYIGKDSTVNFAAWTFNGADMRNFLDTLYRNQFAALGYPICVVLGQMSSGSNQAARSDWMQYYRTCTRRQDAHIAQCTSIIDESILREAVARGELANPDGDWQRMLEGKYIRPARSMPDPLKEAQAVAAWAEVGRDLTSLYADAGIDFRESIMTRAENDQLMKDQGVAITTAQAVPLPNATPTPPAPGADPGAPAGESPDETQEIDPAGDGDEDADPDETQELPAKAGPAPTTRKPAAAKPGTKDAA
jgi:capsid protein